MKKMRLEKKGRKFYNFLKQKVVTELKTEKTDEKSKNAD